jgi:hypothetical protein
LELCPQFPRYSHKENIPQELNKSFELAEAFEIAPELYIRAITMKNTAWSFVLWVRKKPFTPLFAPFQQRIAAN